MIIQRMKNAEISKGKIHANKMDHKEAENGSSSSSGQIAATLYNFGYTAKEVIEKFQVFCYEYSTLGEAIYALLKRDKSLKRKYRFISTPVTYQMLARPTTSDRPAAVRSAMLAMHNYTKDGKYKSVADAVEELLFSPDDSQKYKSVATNTNAWCSKEAEYECTMLSEVEQDALGKIADALYLRLYGMEKLSPEKPKRSKTSPSMKKATSSYLLQLSQNEQVRLDKDVKSLSNVQARQHSRMDCTNAPWYNTNNVPSNFMQTTVNTPGESSMVLHNPFVESYILPVDIEMLTPLLQLTSEYEPPVTTLSRIKRKVLAEKFQSGKVLFLLNCLDLVPSACLQSNDIIQDMNGLGEIQS